MNKGEKLLDFSKNANIRKVCESELDTMIWSGLVDQEKVDRLTGQKAIFDILELWTAGVMRKGHQVHILYIDTGYLSLYTLTLADYPAMSF